jgi:hypothetical protein
MTDVVKRKANHPLHSMCSYLGSYPPHVPRALIARWIPADKAVVDTFCGGGTTLVEAALSGRPAIGIDRNPLAVALSTAKLQPVKERTRFSTDFLRLRGASNRGMISPVYLTKYV